VVITLRPFRRSEDQALVSGLDTSFTTERIYRITRTNRAFALNDVQVMPPLRKSYPLNEQVDTLAKLAWVQVAIADHSLVGLVAMSFEEWNRRALLQHLYVTAPARGRGVGRLMLEGAIEEARRRKARCLWVETQTVNYAAIRFYERHGFTLCGLDTSLYDPHEVDAGEVAIYFSRTVE
jgi:ribosomal protein S18 acetylase RimI-like enzyme